MNYFLFFTRNKFIRMLWFAIMFALGIVGGLLTIAYSFTTRDPFYLILFSPLGCMAIGGGILMKDLFFQNVDFLEYLYVSSRSIFDRNTGIGMCYISIKQIPNDPNTLINVIKQRSKHGIYAVVFVCKSTGNYYMFYTDAIGLLAGHHEYMTVNETWVLLQTYLRENSIVIPFSTKTYRNNYTVIVMTRTMSEYGQLSDNYNYEMLADNWGERCVA